MKDEKDDDEGKKEEPSEPGHLPHPFFGRHRLGWSANPWMDSFFGDLDREFERMHRQMDMMFENVLKEVGGSEDGPNSPMVYGWSMRVGPDGKPQFQEFGNTKGLARYGSGGTTRALDTGQQERGLSVREPLTDLIVEDDRVYVTAELPGVQKKDIELEAFEDHMTIDVDTEDRRYHKKIDLPDEVVPDTIKASFKNGVLDVTITKRKKEGPKPRRIDID